MTGRLYIDGVDAYTEYGIYITEEGYNELVCMPPLKTIDTNDWHEEDGIEADLSAPKLDAKDISLKIAVTDLYGGYVSLQNVLSDGSYHTFNVAHIGRTYKLRLVSVQVTSNIGNFSLLMMKFSDDFPLNGYTYQSPASDLSYNGSYKLDDVAFSQYGVHVLKGSLSEITKTPDVKGNMLRNIKTLSGAIYDPNTVSFKSKEVKLYCLMTAQDLTSLWRNWDALLYNLTKPNERSLYVDALGKTFYLYYKSCQVTKFFIDGKIWLQFTLTVVFTRDFRL